MPGFWNRKAGVRSQEDGTSRRESLIDQSHNLTINIIEEKHREKLGRGPRSGVENIDLLLDVRVVRLNEVYIACWPLDNFLSFHGLICRRFKVASKLDHHATSFHPLFKQMTTNYPKSWQYKYTALSFYEIFSCLPQCRQDLLQIFNNKSLPRPFHCIYLVSFDDIFFLAFVGLISTATAHGKATSLIIDGVLWVSYSLTADCQLKLLVTAATTAAISTPIPNLPPWMETPRRPRQRICCSGSIRQLPSY